MFRVCYDSPLDLMLRYWWGWWGCHSLFSLVVQLSREEVAGLYDELLQAEKRGCPAPGLDIDWDPSASGSQSGVHEEEGEGDSE